MKLLLLILFNATFTGAIFAQRSLPGTDKATMEHLIETFEMLQNMERPIVQRGPDNPPNFELEEAITRSTNLIRLANIQKRVAKKLGINLIFREIQFDSSGLTSISIGASSATRTYQTVTLDISHSQDLGIYALKNRHYQCFFMGTKSSWQSQWRDVAINH